MKKTTDVELSQLIKQTQNGNTEAFGELIRQYQDAVYATALHYTGSFADAQDVAQETFIEAYKSLHRLREPDKFPSWLHTITLHQCHRWLRQQKELVPIEAVKDTQMLEISNANRKSLQPDEALERKELRRIVLSAISSLPKKVGEAVTMYYIDGLSYHEIANFLSVPTSTVKGRLQMGKKQLKEELIAMVEETLKQNRPDERFTEKVLTEIVEQAKAAWNRRDHDEVLQLCEKALETLDHLETTEEHKRTRIKVLNWQGDEWLSWFGNPQKAVASFRHAAQIAADLGDGEAQAKWLLMQAIALSRLGNYQSYQVMKNPVQDAHVIYGKLGDLQGQIVCEAILDLVDLLPEGWVRIDIPPEIHTGHAIHRYNLIRLKKALTYADIFDKDPNKQKAWYDAVATRRMQRGFEVFRDKSLLGRMGQIKQILDFPLVVGHSWIGQLETPHGEVLSLTSTIESDNDTVFVPAGRFENCLRVVTVAQEPTDSDFSQGMKTIQRRWLCGMRTMWFAPGVGLVKYRHDDDWGGSHTIQLVSHRIENAKEGDYFPLSIGNCWKYERYVDWCHTRLTEGYRLISNEGEKIHVACAMYSDLLDDAAQRDYFQTWLENEKSSSNLRGQAWMLHRLSNVHARLGEQKEVFAFYRQLDELVAKLGNAKLQFDVLVGTEWANPVEFVEERYERALRIAEGMGDLERQKYCLAVMVDFGSRRGRYAPALNAAQRRRQIVMELSDHEELASVEAEIDLAQALSSDPDSKRAIEGGLRSWSRASISEAEVTVGGGGRILPMACDRRPYPPIYDYYFWLDAPLLILPIKIGEKWSFSNLDGAVERVVEADNETISIPAGSFERCVRVKSTVKLRAANEGSPQADEIYNRSKSFRQGEKWMWFAPGVGIVKAEQHHANGKRTIIELVSYHLVESSDAYFPLAIGNIWRYEWRDENGDLLFKEQDRVIYKRDGQFYIACSGYTTNVAEYGTS